MATTFAYGFPVTDKTHIKVVKTVGGLDTTLTVDVDYTVGGVNNSSSATWLVTSPVSGSPHDSTVKLTITPLLPYKQTTDFRNQGSFQAQTHENAFDYLTVVTQMLKELSDRTIKYPVSDTSPTSELVNAANRASKYFGFDASGNPSIAALTNLSTATVGRGLDLDGTALRRAALVNPQTGTSYTILTSDGCKLITHSNASATAYTLPQANSSTFPNGWFVEIENLGAGLVTITPTTSTIDGAATFALSQNQGIKIFSDGTNYSTNRGAGSRVPINAQTGTSYTYVSSDWGKLVTHTNAAAIAGTLPQAGTAFPANWWMYVENRGAGLLTITPTTSTIDGAATLTLGTNQGCFIGSDGTNYFTANRGLNPRPTVNSQTGTTYTYVVGDWGKLVTHSNASAIAGTLPQAGTAFPDGWFMFVQNTGAGTLTITPTTSTIDGAATLVLTQNQGAIIYSNGTNYFTMRGTGPTVFTKSFTSAAQTPAVNTTYTLAHSLGATPKLVLAYIKCTTGEINWSVGDEIWIPVGVGSSSGPYGLTVKRDSTNVIVKTCDGSFIGIYNNSSGVVTTITLGSWELYILAYA